MQSVILKDACTYRIEHEQLPRECYSNDAIYTLKLRSDCQKMRSLNVLLTLRFSVTITLLISSIRSRKCTRQPV